MAKMKLLVTGGAGFIGSNFIRYILEERSDWKVVNLDKLTYAGNLENLSDVQNYPNYRFIRGDITDWKLIKELFRKENFDVVVNFAAESHVDRSILNVSPFIETNVLGTQVLLEAARQYQTALFVQISTDEVYGSIESGSFTEDAPLKPNSPYAASKSAADLLCRAYNKTYGLSVIITRSSNNYGPYQFPEKFIPLMIMNAIWGKPLPVYGKGENVRDWLYVKNNCQAITYVIERGHIGSVYNIGGNCEKRNIEVINLICKILSNHPKTKHLKPEIQFVKDRPGHDFRYSLDCTKIKKELGFKPTTNFKKGLEQTINWYLNHQDWIKRVISGEYQAYYRRVYELGWK